MIWIHINAATLPQQIKKNAHLMKIHPKKLSLTKDALGYFRERQRCRKFKINEDALSNSIYSVFSPIQS